jgi:hypothetical protein
MHRDNVLLTRNHAKALSAHPRLDDAGEGGRDATLGLATLRFVWQVIRLPILTLLVILKPVVTLVFGGLALLGVLMTLFFKLIEAPHFPAWTMLAISIGFGLAPVLYEALIRAFSD